MPEPNDQQEYEKVFDALAGKKSGTSEAKADDTSRKSDAESKKQDPPKKQAEEKPEPKGQTDDDGPAIYAPEKYKTRKAEKEAFDNAQKLLGKRDDDAKAHKALMERLADPEQAAEAIRELAERNNVKLETQKPDKSDEKPLTKVGDIDLSTIEDDEIIDGAKLKAIVAALGTKLEKGQQDLSTVAEPILKERRFKELEEKGGLYSLVRDSEISKIRDELNLAESQGKLKRDEILHLAASALALQDGKLFDSFEKLFGEQYRASLTTKKQLPESGTHTTTETKSKDEMTDEEREEANYLKRFDLVKGR